MSEPQGDREENVRYLTEDYGMDQHEAELLTIDDDAGLWLLRPEMRFALQDADAIEQYEEAAKFAQGLGDMVIRDGLFNDATGQLMLDAAERAWEAANRARRRLEGEEQ